MEELQRVENNRIIDMVNIDELGEVMKRINQFQIIIQKSLRNNVDYGIIPGTKKPTLLKPGAEKILMLLGIRSEFEIIDSTRDFEKGFFQYQIKCKLFKGNILVTEGLGSANTKESKWAKANPYSVENTCMKIAKKRSLVDAALMVASLSDLFTQDLDDMDIKDLVGDEIPKENNNKKIYTDQDGVISIAQAKRLFALGDGDIELIAEKMKKYGYTKSADILKTDYNKICEEVEKKKNESIPEILR